MEKEREPQQKEAGHLLEQHGRRKPKLERLGGDKKSRVVWRYGLEPERKFDVVVELGRCTCAKRRRSVARAGGLQHHRPQK